MTPDSTPAVVPDRDGEKDAARPRGDVHGLGDGGELQGDGDLGRLAEGDDDTGQRLRAEAAQGDLQVVGTDLRVQQVEPPVGPGERLVPGTGGGVDRNHARARQHPQLRVAHDAAERPGVAFCARTAAVTPSTAARASATVILHDARRIISDTSCIRAGVAPSDCRRHRHARSGQRELMHPLIFLCF